MPTGQPDSMTHYDPADLAGSHVERLVLKAMEAGDFDDLPGQGKPIPGAGKRDDDLWWVRSWLERNKTADQEVSSSSP